MSTKAARSKMPLEWKYKQGSVSTSGTDVQFQIDLDLMPNEVAEIHVIESKQIHYPTVASEGTPTVDQIVNSAIGISMDPDYDGEQDMIAGANSELDDLEVFYDHQFMQKFDTEGTEANFQLYDVTSEKHICFNPPILVGTNLGVNCSLLNTPDEFDAICGVRVYFTRRKATVQELNQILLKRR